nr:CRM-domain containing factor CFM3, chloroplastic/mitochondrial [Ipomoea trifida]
MGTVTLSAASPSSAPLMIFRRLLRSATPLLSFSLRPKQPVYFYPQTTPLFTPARPHFLYQTHHFSSNHPLQALLQFQDDVVEGTDENTDDDEIEELEPGAVAVTVTTESSEAQRLHSKLQRLTVKEKKELASYAHSLGKKLKSQQVGKSGITDTVILALGETLEKNELLKLKIHGTCPGELEDVVRQLEQATGSVVVGKIGRTVILYRPSLSKLKAEEKKKLVQRAILKKQMLNKDKKPVQVKGQSKGLVPRPSNRGRRGGSRFSLDTAQK